MAAPLPENLLRTAFAEALARRAEASEGAVRERLLARLAALAGPPEATTGAPPAIAGNAAEPHAGIAALAALAALAPSGEAPELKALGYFRDTWTRLSAERRLTQALARVPDQAGPLNAQQLVHRTLAAMRETAPGYLDHFLAYVDTLMWLERAQGAPGPEPAKKTARTAGGAKAGPRGGRRSAARR